MYEILLRNYVNKLTLDDVKKYASYQNIIATDEELQLIYKFIKKYYYKVFSNDDLDFIEKNLKNKISPDLYQKLLSLYKEQKAKYL